MKEAVELACYLRDLHYMPEQVQDFYPTPSTISTCMYYTELDPRTMQPVYVEKNPHRKAMQRALIQYRKHNNYELVEEALKLAGRQDLIGFGPQCLIRPRQGRYGTGGQGGYRAGANGQNGYKAATGGRGGQGGYKSGANGRGGQGGYKSGANGQSGYGSASSGQKSGGKKRTIRNVHKKKS